MQAGLDPGGRAIDVPLEDLPEVDEHAVVVRASQEEVWEALMATVPRAFDGRVARRAAGALGCDDCESSGEPGQIGSTIPGFLVVRVVRPVVLALEGRHRFSVYGLIFKVETTRDDLTLLRAETRARFPGIAGKAYRLLVIGTRGHVVVVNRLLNAVRGRAEKAVAGGEGSRG